MKETSIQTYLKQNKLTEGDDLTEILLKMKNRKNILN